MKVDICLISHKFPQEATLIVQLYTAQHRLRGVQIKHMYLKVWIENCTHMHTQMHTVHLYKLMFMSSNVLDMCTRQYVYTLSNILPI